jgi:hypothetical protein
MPDVKKKHIKTVLVTMLLFAGLNIFACGDREHKQDIDDITTESITVTESLDNDDVPVIETTSDEPETTLELETTPPEPKEPDMMNALTGLESDIDLRDRRPVAIMINNIKIATPQEGISYADIIYECIVEGGQTRLMVISSEYESLPVLGSVRSSREYFLDFAADFDAIYIHAGGSEKAYSEIKSRKIDNLDGVNMYIPNMFYRDSWRQKNMGYEHSLMTTGEKIVEGIAFKKYRTEIDEDFDSPLDFVPYGTERLPSGGDATYLKVKYSGSHQPYFKYDEKENVYYRWQFLGDPHMDNTANVQLSFSNIIVLYLQSVDTRDAYNHMDVKTVGKGEGYYLYGGKYEVISWEKKSADAPIKLYNQNGDELLVNRGKTFFQICMTSMKDSTEIN